MSPTLYLLATWAGVSVWSSVPPNPCPTMHGNCPIPTSRLLQPVVTLTLDDDPFLVGLDPELPVCATPFPFDGDRFCLSFLLRTTPCLPCRNFRLPVPGLCWPEAIENFSYFLSRAGLLRIDWTFLREKRKFKQIKTIASTYYKQILAKYVYVDGIPEFVHVKIEIFVTAFITSICYKHFGFYKVRYRCNWLSIECKNFSYSTCV